MSDVILVVLQRVDAAPAFCVRRSASLPLLVRPASTSSPSARRLAM